MNSKDVKLALIIVLLLLVFWIVPLGIILTLVGIFLFFAAIVGLIVPRWVKQSTRKDVLLKILLPSFVLFIVGLASAPEPNNTVNSTKDNSMLVQETEGIPVVPNIMSTSYSTLSYKEIKRNFKDMTVVQFEEYVKSIEGTRVKWSGEVEEVTKTWGTYDADINMGWGISLPSFNLFWFLEDWIPDVWFHPTEDQALQLEKGRRITFEGTISTINTVPKLSIVLRDVEIIREK